MATITATKGIKTAFSGGSDEIVCSFSPAARNGVQIEVEGFTLNNCTISAKGASSTAADVIAVASALHVITINTSNGRSVIGEIAISAVAAGSHFVTFIEL